MATTAEQLDGTRVLLGLWRAGDDSARDLLLERLYPVVRRWSRIHVDNADDAEDVAQQALITVYRSMHRFRLDEPLAPWVYRITARTASAPRRRLARRLQLLRARTDVVESGPYITDPGSRVDRERLADRVLEHFRGLPLRQREVFSLVDLEGHTPSEAAEILGIGQSTLRANLFKARSTIRRRLFAEVPELASVFRTIDPPPPVDGDA